MYLKIMEGEGGFRIVEVSEVAFRRYPEPVILYKNGSPDEHQLAVSTRVFLLNEAGDTIESFSPKGR